MKIIGLAGWSGAGKTTLLTKVLPLITSRGKRVSTLKHAHHGFDLDQPGKDSYAHRAAGATEVLIASARRFAVMHELRDAPEPGLRDLLARLSPVDLVIVEGYKRERIPKLEIHRTEVGKPLMQPDDGFIVAVASDRPLSGVSVPVIDLNDIDAVAEMLLANAVPLDRLAAPEKVS